jgi:type II secretion system protein C
MCRRVDPLLRPSGSVGSDAAQVAFVEHSKATSRNCNFVVVDCRVAVFRRTGDPDMRLTLQISKCADRTNLVAVVRLLVLVAIGSTIVDAGWRIVGSPASIPSPDTQLASRPSSAPAHSVDEILAANLFGKQRSADIVGTAQAANVQLQLEGTIEASRGPSVAIVSEHGAPESYHLGQQLPGAARLSVVESGRVVLERDGRRETLAFDRTPAVMNATPSVDDVPPSPDATDAEETTGGTTQVINQADNRAVAESYVRRISASPQAAVADFGLQPVAPAQASGYRIVQKTPYLDRVGLESGDVIVAINGAPVGNPELDHLELANLIAVGATGVTVERDGKVLNLTSSDDPLEARRLRRQETAQR